MTNIERQGQSHCSCPFRTCQCTLPANGPNRPITYLFHIPVPCAKAKGVRRKWRNLLPTQIRSIQSKPNGPKPSPITNQTDHHMDLYSRHCSGFGGLFPSTTSPLDNHQRPLLASMQPDTPAPRAGCYRTCESTPQKFKQPNFGPTLRREGGDAHGVLQKQLPS